MLKNYFKIAFRNLQRNKVYAIINVIGLSLGIACGILIFTLVSYHLSFDDFHNNKNRIFRIVSNYTYADGIEHQQGVQQPLGKAFRNDYSFTEKVARVVTYSGGGLITLPDEPGMKKFVEDKGVAFAEPEFFDVFNFPLVQGDKTTALTQPNSAIITQRIAKKYFGTDNAIGKIIRYKFFAAFINFKITGILKDLPYNTDRKQEIYLSYSNLKDGNPRFASDNNWHTVNSSMQCFVLLKPGISAANAEKVFPAFAEKYLGKEEARSTQFKLQPLSDIHFNTDYDGYADKKYLWSLAFVGIFLIITACVNFINLATAQALNRSKEVGVRKVLGSLKKQLFWQFIAETSLITFFAVVFAYGLSQLALPHLNNLFQTKMQISLFADMRLTVFLFLLIALVIFLSGSYPGLVLTRFQPVAALKGKLSQKNVGGFSLRRILVVTQFAISQMLIIGTIVIAGQMHFSKTSDLGFNKDAIVMLPVPSTDSIGKIKMQTLKNRLVQVSGVENVSFCSEAPASEAVHATDIRFGNRPKEEPFDVSVKVGDDQYLQTFNIKLAAGRNIFPSDTAMEFLVNETLVKKLGLKNPQDIINKNIQVGEKNAPVVGVVKDFYDQSFHNDKSAVCILQQYHNYFNCAVKINLKDTKPVLSSFEKIWNQTYPDYLYSYQFLDERINKFYELDNIMLELIEAFACIAIFIGCLGLYGLVSFMALQKTKEIGVRKVLGASVQSVLWLFGKEFARLLIIAFVIAAPVAWFAMNKYLQDFKYRIHIGFGIFVLAMLSTFVIAAVTVAYRSMKAAIANPVKSLRSE
jgi:putative ABC transport system permease protein